MQSLRVARALCLGLPLLTACGAADDAAYDEAAEPTGVAMEAIIGGTPATAYPEAAVLNMKTPTGVGYACSATLIAPKVVLTAGHCVDGMASWDVYVGTVARPAASAETYDWKENGATTVNPSHHDIGLVYLSAPITLASYPTLNATTRADGTKVLDVGRVLNGTVTSSMYQAAATISAATAVGYPYDYYSPDVIEHGDSGGPVFLSGTHTVIAVNSGAGSGTQVLARVDLMLSWIQGKIASHGGLTGTDTGAGGATGAGGSVGAGGAASTGGVKATGGVASSGGASSTGGVKATGGTASTGGAKATGGTTSTGGTSGTATCTTEKEPNDDLAHATASTGPMCGSLATTKDVDWYSMSLAVGVTTLGITADKDATFNVGYVAGTSCAIALSNQKQVQVKVTGAAAKVCVSVASASHVVQSYRLSR